MSRLPVAAFVALAVATIAAFFVTQHLKVATPLLAGTPAPHPAAINPVDGQVCDGVDHRRMFVSFYLLNRSDDVDVYVENAGGTLVDTLASGVHMVGGNHPMRRGFTWNGRTSSGVVAPDGIYYIRVILVSQDRSVLISNNAGPEPVTVQTIPPRPRVTRVSPTLVPQAAGSGVQISYSGTDGQAPRVLIFRTDLPGGPRLVKTFAGRHGSTSTWDGTIGGHPAPQGTYLIGLKVTDKACNTGRFPVELPPPAGTTAGAGVTVRYLAAQPPLVPVAAGSKATVYVDARQHPYHWALRRAGRKPVLAAGSTRSVTLRVPLPSSGAGLYELALRYGDHRSTVPLIAGPRSGPGGKVLVVLPALTWQGVNPVDDDHDGIPDTLTAGYPVPLARPLVNGLPAGWDDESELLSFVRHHHLSFSVTTDLALALATPGATGLSSYRGVILAGDETWLAPSLASALRTYVTGGGHVLSLGIDSLRRGVTLNSTRAYDPTAPRSTDALGARVGPVTPSRGSLILAGHDALHLFSGTSGTLRYPTFQSFPGLSAPLAVASEAGVSPSTPAVIAYRLGHGLVIDVGLPGFGSSLAHNFDGQQLMLSMYRVLTR
ncbi:MAG: FlgD immunoglobulin-like domain containing protein [Solirubrobacteraceae bacterium]